MCIEPITARGLAVAGERGADPDDQAQQEDVRLITLSHCRTIGLTKTSGDGAGFSSLLMQRALLSTLRNIECRALPCMIAVISHICFDRSAAWL